MYVELFFMHIRQAHINNDANMIWILVSGTEDDFLWFNMHMSTIRTQYLG